MKSRNGFVAGALLAWLCVGCDSGSSTETDGQDAGTADGERAGDATSGDTETRGDGRTSDTEVGGDARVSDGAAGDGKNAVDAAIPSEASVAKSCSLADVMAAVAAAAAGDTVVIPAGQCTWGDGGAFLSIDKAITLRGTARGDTTIVLSDTAASWTSGTIRLAAAATVKSLTILSSKSSGAGTAFSTSANGFRIGDVEFVRRSASTSGYFAYVESYGLIDSCDVTGGTGSDEMIFARGPADSWQTSSSLGTNDNLFIEDSTFRGQGYVTDCNSNSRCVVRYNTITGPIKIDGHGKASNTPPRGVREIEIYGNTWASGGGYWPAIEVRGGTGRVFDNTSQGDGPWLILHEYAATATWPNFNNTIQTVYPIDDQIGVGKDPKVGASEPMVLWNNVSSGKAWAISLGYGDQAVLQKFIQADRDYYAQAATFDGSSGVGRGTKAQMQAITPTKTGVGFWVTDEGEWNSQNAGADGTLYVWSGSQWSASYTPYSYPHPRRAE